MENEILITNKESYAEMHNNLDSLIKLGSH